MANKKKQYERYFICIVVIRKGKTIRNRAASSLEKAAQMRNRRLGFKDSFLGAALAGGSGSGAKQKLKRLEKQTGQPRLKKAYN
ncbi:MAG: hypothetical protein OHK0053_19180 [Microscillaceae bacterium]